jgi:hypothetical protein
MKYIIFFIAFIFATSTVTAQNNQVETGNALNNLNDKLISGNSFGSSMMFYNPKRQIDGKFHLYENWNNTAIIHTLSDDKFLVKRVNLNLQRNSFESKMNNSDSIFSFTFNNIKKIVIGQAVYKNFYYNDDNRVYQMLYESEKYKLMKGFEVKLISGSANPMVNRPNDKYVNPIKLKKKSLYKTLELDKSNTSRLNMFVESNSLSLKKEEDIVKLLEYFNTI